MNLTNNDAFSKDFIDYYSKRGFGSMNKNDFEVLIFDLLRKHGDLKNKKNYEASILLQIPESKVKRLEYEADLKYGNIPSVSLIQAFFEIISNSKFQAENNKIKFSIENKLLRATISDRLKKLGSFADSSFNAEIISINIDSFIALLEDCFSNDEIKHIVKECKSIVKIDNGEEINFKMIMKNFIEGAASKAGETLVDAGLTYLTGGLPTIIQTIKQFTNSKNPTL